MTDTPKNKTSLLDASTRIALAAYLHDLGKLAERARLEIPDEQLDIHVQLYCPRHDQNGRQWYSHKHAAYTALAFGTIENHLPALKGTDFFPFASCNTCEADDSLVNAAAKHHKPENFLQWIIATADRVASGFERDSFEKYNQSEDKTDTGRNHYQARQLNLLESIRLQDAKTPASAADLEYRQPLLPLTPENLFPQPRKQAEGSDDTRAQQEYRAIWDAFLKALEIIPSSHRHNLPLWLDHFDSLWRIYTHAIPSATAFGVKPDVSLYDHSRTTAALAAALWRYHHENGHDPVAAAAGMKGCGDWHEEKLLLIQGDFFGIQNFIFAGDSDATQKNAARLLRGRSLYVSLLAETAALKVLDALQLPATSQILNAAGKFLIVAPNTTATTAALQKIQKEIDGWFLQHTYGQSGLGMAWATASCQQFVARQKQGGFRDLMKTLFTTLEHAKYQSFNLLGDTPPSPVFTSYLEQVGEAGGLCQYTGWGPGSIEEDGQRLSPLASDQIHIGRLVAGKRERLAITRQPLSGGSNTLRLPVFGYYLHFTDSEEASGRFGNEARTGNLRRLIDFSLADAQNPSAWHGYARRNINGYVPLFDLEDQYADWRYKGIGEDDSREPGTLKTLNHLACENRRLRRGDNDNEQAVGIQALGILKGDVDNLGAIFQKGLEDPTFARMAGLSRQMDSFFSSYLPWLCQQKYPDTYTVFAGGDDFFLIGPWYSLTELAQELNTQFQRYAADNPALHFSAGIALAKPGQPIHQLSRMAEEALAKAKQHPGKNAVHLLGETLSWQKLAELSQASETLQKLADEMKLSTGFIYSLLGLSELASDKKNPEHALWRSRLNYRAWRHLQRRNLREHLGGEPRAAHVCLMQALGANGIEKHGSHYRVAVTTHLYLNRH